MDNLVFYNNLVANINFLRHRQLTTHMTVETTLVHSHNLLWLYHGEGLFQIDNKKYLIPENSIIYYPPGHYQQISTIEGKPLFYHSVKFKAATISDTDSDEGLKIFDESFGFPFYKTFTDVHVIKEFQKKFEKMSRIYFSNQSSLTNLFYEPFFLIDILKYIDSIQKSSYMKSNNRQTVDAIISYIESHFQEDISLSTLSNLANTSGTYLNKLFKMSTGTTPINYLINMRILKSKGYLESGFSVSDAAIMSGFTDIYHFSNTFKRIEGISPSTYRNLFINS